MGSRVRAVGFASGNAVVVPAAPASPSLPPLTDRLGVPPSDPTRSPRTPARLSSDCPERYRNLLLPPLVLPLAPVPTGSTLEAHIPVVDDREANPMKTGREIADPLCVGPATAEPYEQPPRSPEIGSVGHESFARILESLRSNALKSSASAAIVPFGVEDVPVFGGGIIRRTRHGAPGLAPTAESSFFNTTNVATTDRTSTGGLLILLRHQTADLALTSVSPAPTQA